MKQIEQRAQVAAIAARAEVTLIQFLESQRGTEMWNVAEECAPMWYPSAQDFSHNTAAQYNVHPYIGDGIVAAFSINTRWVQNQEHTLCFYSGDEITSGFGIRRAKAEELLAYGVCCRLRGEIPDLFEIEKILNGNKIRRFARTITNPDAWCIVIDSWMIKVLGVTINELKRVGVYEALEDMMLRLMPTYGFDVPSTWQAFVWILVRGKAD